MGSNAFSAGVEPGGLRTKDEIRILLCYLLASVNAPLSKDDIVSILQENGLANYFEVTEAISEMAGKGMILLSGEGDSLCSIGETGRMVSGQLDTTLPSVVRKKAVGAAINLLAQAKREKENTVEINPVKNGYEVTCHISGGNTDLMKFSLYVPDQKQAEMVRGNFQRSPETVYRMLLALVTGNKEFAADLIR
jgi:hypothetical protein